MAITVISMADGAGVEYLPSTADVDYLADGENVDQLNTNRPMKNLAFRDTVFRDKINEMIAILNNAAGTTADVAARLDAEHDPDGTHPGGAPHTAASIPGGHNYLSIAPLQILTANVDNPAVPTGGSGLLVAADDIRLAGNTFVAVGTGGDYATPKAALDAGKTKLLLFDQTFNDTGGGAMNLTAPVIIIGVGAPVWQHVGLTLSAGAEGSLISRVNFDGAAATLTISCNNVAVDHLSSVNATATPVTLSSCSYIVLYDIDITPVAGVNALDATSAQHIHLERYYCGGIRNTVALDVSGIYLNSGCSNWVVKELHCECAAVGDTTKDQRAVTFAHSVSQMQFNGVYLERVKSGFYYSDTAHALSNITINGSILRNMASGDVGGSGGWLFICVATGGGVVDVTNLNIKNIDADSGSTTFAQVCYIDTGTGDAKNIFVDNVVANGVGAGVQIDAAGAGLVERVLVSRSRFIGNNGGVRITSVAGGSDYLFTGCYFENAPTLFTCVNIGGGSFENIAINDCKALAGTGSSIFYFNVDTLDHITVSNCVSLDTSDLLVVDVSTSTTHISVVGCHVAGGGGSAKAILSLLLGAVGTAKYITVSECTAYGAMYLVEIVAAGTDQVNFGTVCACSIETTATHTCIASGTHNNFTFNISGNTWKAATGLFSGALFADAGSNLNNP